MQNTYHWGGWNCWFPCRALRILFLDRLTPKLGFATQMKVNSVWIINKLRGQILLHPMVCWETKSYSYMEFLGYWLVMKPPHPHHYITVTSLWKGSRAMQLPAILSTCSAPESLLGVNLDMVDKRCQVMNPTNKMQWVGFKFCFLFGSVPPHCCIYLWFVGLLCKRTTTKSKAVTYI